MLQGPSNTGGRNVNAPAVAPPGTGFTPSREVAYLQFYQELVEPGFTYPTQLFEAGLRLLVEQLDVESAAMTRITQLGCEAIWWATRDGSAPGPEVFEPTRTYFSQVLDAAYRTLIIRDAQTDPAYQDHPALRELSIRAYLGVPLRTSEGTLGVLSVQSAMPQAFSHNQVVLANLVGNMFSRTMEIELLRHELRSTRESLDLTVSVIQESALEAPDSGLPSRGYLEVWLKAYLFLARRRNEPLAVALWTVPPSPETHDRLRTIADRARGEDLLVDLGRDTYAMLLPRATPQGAEVILERVRDQLGPLPIGATLWQPGNPADAEDLTLRNALRRAMAALRRCRQLGPQGGRRAVWDLPLVVGNPQPQARRIGGTT